MDNANPTKTPPSRLILASSSTYRAKLLARLGIDFEKQPPDIDETPENHETGGDLALRLAKIKATHGQTAPQDDPLIIGSDQVAVCEGLLMGKPGSPENAERQLIQCAGKRVQFFTGLALWRPRQNALQTKVVTTEVAMRALTRAEIARYVVRDQPLDCAGSFKWESLGISLFTKISGPDPTALEGLPLIALSEMLRSEGYQVP